MNHLDVINYIKQNFTNFSHEFPWDDMPNASIFRHTDNRKWFALLMQVQYSTLHLNRPGATYILNLKSEPDLIETLVRQPSFLPAYHMNKTHWLTVLLDGSASPSEIQPLIHLSYQLTAKKYRQAPSPML